MAHCIGNFGTASKEEQNVELINLPVGMYMLTKIVVNRPREAVLDVGRYF